MKRLLIIIIALLGLLIFELRADFRYNLQVGTFDFWIDSNEYIKEKGFSSSPTFGLFRLSYISTNQVSIGIQFSGGRWYETSWRDTGIIPSKYYYPENSTAPLKNSYDIAISSSSVLGFLEYPLLRFYDDDILINIISGIGLSQTKYSLSKNEQLYQTNIREFYVKNVNFSYCTGVNIHYYIGNIFSLMSEISYTGYVPVQFGRTYIRNHKGLANFIRFNVGFALTM